MKDHGTAVSEISAALILADKSDVHRDRVVNKNIATFDIHDSNIRFNNRYKNMPSS